MTVFEYLAEFLCSEHGPIKLSTFLLNYRVGDIVDIKANAAQQKGMPHKFYHGRTGIVYNVTPHAVGVIVNKVVGNRYIEKRVNIRIEHVRHSKCRQEFLDRVKRNEKLRAEAKAKGGTYLFSDISSCVVNLLFIFLQNLHRSSVVSSRLLVKHMLSQ